MYIKKSKFRSCCSINCSAEILGDKWTLLIIRDALLIGSSTYKDFSKIHGVTVHTPTEDSDHSPVTCYLYTGKKKAQFKNEAGTHKTLCWDKSKKEELKDMFKKEIKEIEELIKIEDIQALFSEHSFEVGGL